MWEQVDVILRRAATQIAQHVADFLPGALVSIVLLLITAAVALLGRVIVVRALRSLEFDRRAGQFGWPAGWSAAAAPSQAAGRAVFWTLLVLGILVSLTALNATLMQPNSRPMPPNT